MHEVGWGFMVIGSVLYLAFWVAAIAGAVWLATRIWRRGDPTRQGADSISILSGRYARGEIEREEYLARCAELGR